MKKSFLISFFAAFGSLAFAQCPNVIATSASTCSSAPIQLNASSGFTTYFWSPIAGLSNPNIANPIASISGNYIVTSTVNGPELIANPDFSAGNSGFISGQNFTTNYSPCNYWVGAIWFSSYYPQLTDHTATADNMFMHVDGCTSVTSLWEETVTVTPNTNYAFSFWASRSDQIQPTFEMHFIGNSTGNNILNTTPGIPYTGVWTWDQYGVPVWNSGSNTSVTLQVVNLQTNSYGNDFGLDDFSFQQFCTSSDTVQVTIAPPPNIGPDTSVCNNSAIVLDGGSANNYLWNTGDTTQTITVSSAGQYFVTTTIGNCFFSDTVNVAVTTLPPVNLGNDTILCGTYIELNANAAPQSTFLWNTGSSNPTILANASGTYSVNVTLSSCSISDTIQITVAEPVQLGNDLSLCGLNNPRLDAGNPGSTYLWSTGSTDQVIDVSGPGTYWVQVTTGTCISMDTVEASGTPGEGIIFIPNSFSPNKNGLNDRFYVYGDGIMNFHLQIFNRWGQLIFETTDINSGWDGTYKGKLVENDTYVYVVDYQTQCNSEEGQNVIGHVNVIR